MWPHRLLCKKERKKHCSGYTRKFGPVLHKSVRYLKSKKPEISTANFSPWERCIQIGPKKKFKRIFTYEI
jgi:hypothetical protein